MDEYECIGRLAGADSDNKIRYAISAAGKGGIRQGVQNTRENNEQDGLDDIQLSAQRAIQATTKYCTTVCVSHS